MPITITNERPDSPDAMALVTELDDAISPLYAVESRHGYSVEKLLREGVAFFVLRQDGTPAACGGVQFYGTEYAELKRMFVRPAFRGAGLGAQLLAHLEAYTRQQGFRVLRLETGIYQEAAIRLYERTGFTRIPPFGNYVDDPVSLCYEKQLT